MNEKNYKELFNALLNDWHSHNNEIAFDDLLDVSNEYINSIYSEEIMHLRVRDAFLTSEPRLSSCSNEQRMSLLYLLDLIGLFQWKVFEIKEYIEIYIGGSPTEIFSGRYDFPYKLLFNNILVGFENLVEIYQKISLKKYKKDNITFEEVLKFDTEKWIEKENIFKTLNFLRRIYVHSEGCLLRGTDNKKYEAVLDKQIIYFKNDLGLKFTIYAEDKSIIGERSCNLNITKFLTLVYEEFFNSLTPWEDIFQKLEK